MVPVILSGGVGTRLWPLSHNRYPKQFHSFFGGLSLIQQTAQRVQEIPGSQAPIVVCNLEHRFLVGEQLRQVGVSPFQIIVEPVGRNTAAAAALSAFSVLDRDPLLFFCPSDHLMDSASKLVEALHLGVPEAKNGSFVTFGVVPKGPNPEYGYIEVAKVCPVSQLVRFTEKPSVRVAEEILRKGNCLWNSGMFLCKASAYLKALKKYAPKIYQQSEKAVSSGRKDLDFVYVDKKSFDACPSESIDNALLEKMDSGSVVLFQGEWLDAGSWSAIWGHAQKDSLGNVKLGNVIAESTKNSFLHSKEKRLVAIGVENLVVVNTDEALLVAHLDDAHRVKTLLSYGEDN